ncbi:hypothetical protein [Kutzneria sp. CA-103260]|uniref:hypothetical protein n=1 Tax=Kutzneria sp. CA-103260 TaxID=2802641 RepID=UPI001BACB707|nr:hypothetical protein [Kutzneria sp. CA-103260]QUQ67547.1 hypothetical protein JJ691_52820 [Kutzneria sp. CA-103260]
MRKPIMLLGGAAIVLLLAGCGGGDNGSTVASLSSPNTSSSAAPAAGDSGSGKGADLDQYRKYAKCMRDHGYDMKDPDPNSNSVAAINPNDPKFAPAEQACKSVEPTGGGPGPDDPQVRDKMLKYAKCMRDHGYDMKDPKPGEGLTLPMGGSGDQKLDAASKACGPILK